ncbi:MAG: outer membrane beta-barrel protein [Saprospiraceae bacterium]|nr:outer membrane beta-barrel protein [Saprospiraceae bacterium]
MKNIFLILFLLITITLSAQEPPTPPAPPSAPSPEMKSDKKKDTTRINLGGTEVLIIEKENNKNDDSRKDDEDEEDDDDNDKDDEDMNDDDKAHMKKHKENTHPAKKSKSGAKVGFLDVDLGVNLFANSGDVSETLKNDLDLKFWSWSTTLNFLPTKIYLGSRNVRLMTAIGWRIGNYKFDNSIQFEPNQDLVYSLDSNIRRSRLHVQHLQVPLMLYFQSNKIKGLGRIGIGLGGYAGVKVHERSEVCYQNIDRHTVTKEDFGFEKFRYGVSGRVDIGFLKLFANLDLSDTWASNDLRTLECGLWFDF